MSFNPIYPYAYKKIRVYINNKQWIGGFVCLLPKKKLGCKNWTVVYFFSYLDFFERHWQLTGQQRMEGDHHYYLLPSTPDIKFAVWHLRWLPSSINRNTCKYQNKTPTWMFIRFTSRFYVRSYWSNFPQKSCGFELTLTIMLSLKMKQRTRWGSPCSTHICVWKQKTISIILMP